MTKTILGVAAAIREVDGDNQLTPENLGYAIAGYLVIAGQLRPVADVVAFVERTNPDKKMGAAELAELIVAEFRLDEES